MSQFQKILGKVLTIIFTNKSVHIFSKSHSVVSAQIPKKYLKVWVTIGAKVTQILFLSTRHLFATDSIHKLVLTTVAKNIFYAAQNPFLRLDFFLLKNSR